MMDIFNYIRENLTPGNAVFIVIVYAVIHSKTTLGFLLRIFLLWVIFKTFQIHAANGDYLEGILMAAIMAVVIYFPLIIRQILKFIKMFLEMRNN